MTTTTSQFDNETPGATSFPTTWTTTDGNGNPVTESGIAIVTTDSDGSLTTTTSAFGADEASRVEQTTEIVTTDNNGDIFTKTVFVCETTASDGEVETVSSVAPRTTTLVSSDEQGAPTTATAAIFESTVDGTVTYYTSICEDSSASTTVDTKSDVVSKSPKSTNGEVERTPNGVVPTGLQTLAHSETEASKTTETTNGTGATIESTDDITSIYLAPSGSQTTFESIYRSTDASEPASVSSYAGSGSLPSFNLKWLLPFAFFAAI